MSPSLLNPYALKVISSAYKATVLADSPWGFWLLDDPGTVAGTVYLDQTANARNMSLTTSSGAPNDQQPGPSALFKSILWPTSDNTYAACTATFGFSVGTIEAWVYLTAAPTSAPVQVGSCQNNGAASNTKFLRINTNRTVSFGVTLSSFATSVGTVPLNTWTHIIGSIGAAGAKVRINKVTDGTNVATSSSSSGLTPTVHRREAAATQTVGAVLYTSCVAVWSSQLTDAKTDAHYDAMVA